MRIILTALILSFALAAGTLKVSAEELKPLAKLNLNMDDLTDLSYVALRCSALYASQYKVVPNSDATTQKLRQVAKNLHKVFFMVAGQAAMGARGNNAELSDAITSTIGNRIISIAESYSASMERNYRQSESYFEGELVSSDSRTCGMISQKLRK
jgi:hypothetical protein